MSEQEEYNFKKKQIFTILSEFILSLDESAPNEKSREYYSSFLDDLNQSKNNLYSSIKNKNSLEMKNCANEIKCILSEINASSTKGEIPIGRSDLLNQLVDLIYIFQESKFKSCHFS